MLRSWEWRCRSQVICSVYSSRAASDMRFVLLHRGAPHERDKGSEYRQTCRHEHGRPVAVGEGGRGGEAGVLTQEDHPGSRRSQTGGGDGAKKPDG